MTALVVADTHEVVAPSITAELFGGFDGEAAREAARSAAPALYEQYAERAAKNTKAGVKGMTIEVKDQRIVSPFDLHVEAGWNSRDMNDPENLAHIERLALSIAEIGVQEPLKVRFDDGKLKIRNGHCRYFATMLAILKHGAAIEGVPVITVQKGTNDIDDLFLQATTNDIKPLSGREYGDLIVKIMRKGVSTPEIARRMARSISWVEHKLSLMEADSSTLAKVTSGQVSETLAVDVVRSVGPAKAKEVVEQAIEKAAAEGRDKATKKDVDAVIGRRSHAKTIAELRKAIDKPLSTSGEKVTIDKEVWDRIKELLDA